MGVSHIRQIPHHHSLVSRLEQFITQPRIMKRVFTKKMAYDTNSGNASESPAVAESYSYSTRGRYGFKVLREPEAKNVDYVVE